MPDWIKDFYKELCAEIINILNKLLSYDLDSVKPEDTEKLLEITYAIGSSISHIKKAERQAIALFEALQDNATDK